MAKRVTKRTRLAQKRRKRKLIVWATIICIALLILAAAIAGLRHKRLAITTISIIGAKEVSKDALQSSVRKELEIMRSFVVYGGTVFSYDEAHIVQSLLHTYPRLADVHVGSRGIGELRVSVTERVPEALWCAKPAEHCYRIDADGFIFNALELGTYSKLAERYITYRGNVSGEPLRQTLLHGGFARVHAFATTLSEVGIAPTLIQLADDELTLQSKEHPLLKVKINDDLKRTLSYIRVTLDSQEYKDTLHAEGDDTEVKGIEYIDLRFGNRVYYK